MKIVNADCTRFVKCLFLDLTWVLILAYLGGEWLALLPVETQKSHLQLIVARSQTIPGHLMIAEVACLLPASNHRTTFLPDRVYFR